MAFGRRNWAEAMRRIAGKLRLLQTTIILSEVMSPGGQENVRRNGLHINEDHFLIEVVDPKPSPLPEGKTGELVITTLTKEAFPVMRFRTRDLTSLITEPCACGRTFVKMSKVMGRTDDMIKIKGITVFPSQIESVLFEIEGTEPHFQVILERKAAVDELTVLVEVLNLYFSIRSENKRILLNESNQDLHPNLAYLSMLNQ
jgi:phenylacetate-CoA ligase